jgi:hypothetical protein
MRDPEEHSRHRKEEPLRQSQRLSDAARKREEDGRLDRRGDTRSRLDRDGDSRLRGEQAIWGRGRDGRRSASYHREYSRRDAEYDRREGARGADVSWGRPAERGTARGDQEVEMWARREDLREKSRNHKRAHSRSVRWAPH